MKCADHERQGKDEKFLQSAGGYGEIKLNAIQDPEQDPAKEQGH